MTDAQKIQIGKLRGAGLGYKKIAEQMGLSENTVKTYCRRHGLGGNMTHLQNVTQNEEHHCLCCGKPVQQIPGRKEKKFCSDKCRMAFWNSHQDEVNKQAYYNLICLHCGKEFESYGNQNRKYCSRDCYVIARFHTPTEPNPVPDCPGSAGQAAA